MNTGKYITRQEAAKILGVSPQTITNYMSKGVLSWKKTGAGYSKLVLREEIERLSESIEEFSADVNEIEQLKTELRKEKSRLRSEVRNTSESVGDLNVMFDLAYRIFKQAVTTNMDSLCERERHIAEIIFKKKDPYFCLRDVAEDFCLSRERVRQIICRMMKRISMAIESKEEQIAKLEEEIKSLQEQINAQNTVERNHQDACSKGYKGKVFAMKLVDANLSVRSLNCLKAADIKTVGDLVSYEKEDIFKLRNLGRKSQRELTEFLEKLGLSFGMQTDEILNTLRYVNVPNRIYLHTGISFPENGSMTADFSELEGVTWSDEQIGSSDLAFDRVARTKK